MKQRWSVAFLIFAVLAGACSSSTSNEQASSDTSEQEAVSGEDDVNQTAAEIAGDGVPSVPGAPLNRFDLQIGQCFNEGSWYDEELDRRVDLTASIECDRAHQNEVYYEAEFPAPNGAPYPGDTKMTEWSTQVCYDAFNDFVEADYEISTFEIGVVQPTKDTFEHPVGRHRRVFCYVYDLSADTSVGSARGSGV